MHDGDMQPGMLAETSPLLQISDRPLSGSLDPLTLGLLLYRNCSRAVLCTSL